MLKHSFKILFLFFNLLFTLSYAANLNLSNVPLFLGGSVEPNIVFTLDDSGSMHWENMPGSSSNNRYVYPNGSRGIYRGNGSDTGDYVNRSPQFDDLLTASPTVGDFIWSVRARSSEVNKLYYNPEVKYTPWANYDGTLMPNANPVCALHNGYEPDADNDGNDYEGRGDLPAGLLAGDSDNLVDGNSNGISDDCRNLTVTNEEFATNWRTANNTGGSGFRTFYPAVYYRYINVSGNSLNDRNDYEKVEIRSGSTYPPTGNKGPKRTDCTSTTTCTYIEEMQNFANWYSYYRSRILVSRAGVGHAFSKQGTAMRVGFASLNKASDTIDGESSDGAMVRGLRPFESTEREAWFETLYGYRMRRAGTPLRTATEYVGEYFTRSDNSGPWSATPGTSDATPHLACRQSYNVLMTDGYYTSSDVPSVGNSDNVIGSIILAPDSTSYQYTPSPPYSDTHENTLADVGMEYWKTDLRTDLANKVPTNTSDTAFWQHLVTFTVGLGVTGNLDPPTPATPYNPGDLPGLTDGSITWSNPTNNAGKIDDLWHTALNSRGNFFSASDPDTFAASLSSILSNIVGRSSSASSVALNSGTVSGDSKLYQAKFNSGDWTGQLLAYPINANGSLGALAWDAAANIPPATDRVLITYDGTDGQPFRWNSGISSAQQTLIGSENALNYLRGDQSLEEANGGSFRNRNSLLGDIVHASPTYIGPPSLRYPDNWGASSLENGAPYSSFKSSHSSRQPYIYAGANDGMLHAFNAATGVEKFAYIPNAIYPKLSDLADTSYNHQFFVDGSPTVADAFFDGNWHTILVSGLRGGGQGVFALDITNPNNFSNESNGAAKILWEFTDSDDADLGYTFGKPSIVRLHNGVWAAVFSGGYNNTYDDDGDGSATNDSTTGSAVLFIVNLKTGALIKKFDTEVGTANDPTGNGQPNGLSTPAVIDFDGNSIADAIYAGDLFGNIWKIDISQPSPSQWKFSYKSGIKPDPIYTACAGTTCSGSNMQSITTQPQIIQHPTNKGYLVLFGTGRYFEVGDNSSIGQTTQSVYGIWDKVSTAASAPSFHRGSLLEQSITQEVTQFGYDLRVTTDTHINWASHNGWYMDLLNTQSSNTNNLGERQVSNTIIRNGRLVFTTLIPSPDPCDFGGTGWLMEIDVYSGARLKFTPFDLNHDGQFDIDDYVNIGDIDGDGHDDYVASSGKKSTVGIIPTPSITETEGGLQEYKYTSGSTGAIELTVENPGSRPSGRQSWQQLF